MQLHVNGTPHSLDPIWEEETLLFALREGLGVIGPKLGCGLGQCGACTVLVDGGVQRSCVLRAKDVAHARITTVEGLSHGPQLHPVQQAWLDHCVPQCGYCQAGHIMGTVALLRHTPHPTDDDITTALSGNLCRCGTHQRIREAIHLAAQRITAGDKV
ncbi:MAG: (2Fe-2S)-binding protein [Rhodoferax sp.]|nr:(2Fe-2S)-binding protein [Rhodoferax sp.]